MTKYNLVFDGNITEEFTLQEVKENFKNHYNLSDLKLSYLFSGKDIILKKDLTQIEVIEQAALMDSMGAVTYIEEINKEVYLPAGVEHDRRMSERRQKADRRKTSRYSGIYYDRRIQDRRLGAHHN